MYCSTSNSGEKCKYTVKYLNLNITFKNYKVGIYAVGCVIIGFAIYLIFIASKRLPKVLYTIDGKFQLIILRVN